MIVAAREAQAALARVAALGLIVARRAFEDGSLARLVATVTAVQAAAASAAAGAVPAILDEQGIDSAADGVVVPAAFAGIASDGRPLRSLLELIETRAQFDRIVGTQFADAGRAGAVVAAAAVPAVDGWTRVVSPGACSRCIVLAGRFYAWNAGFARHPLCMCSHAATSSAVAAPESPAGVFDAMTAAEQDATFGKAGATAIRAGADIGQVVNARRGMERAQGRALVTREGVTAGGVAGRLLGGRARLMPETIMELASDREDAVRLLRAHGYMA